MAVYFMVRREKTTMFLEARENTLVNQVKRMIEGITKIKSSNQRLYYSDQVLDETKTLFDYGIKNDTALVQAPATIGLTYKLEDGVSFEKLEISPISEPRELPEVMEGQHETKD